VNANVMACSLKGTSGHALPSGFRKLAGRLGGSKADFPSHFPVAFEIIGMTWGDRSLTTTVRQAVVGNILEKLTRERRREEVVAIIKAFDDFAKNAVGSAGLRQYLRVWLRGHFIVLEPTR
jgi:hypothetical protein